MVFKHPAEKCAWYSVCKLEGRFARGIAEADAGQQTQYFKAQPPTLSSEENKIAHCTPSPSIFPLYTRGNKRDNLSSLLTLEVMNKLLMRLVNQARRSVSFVFLYALTTVRVAEQSV